MATDLFLTPHRFFGIVFLQANTFRQANTLQCFKSLLKTHLFKASFLYLPICILYLSLIVYFIVSFMRLEAFALGALQMSYYY